MKRIDFVGKRFGRLVVIREGDARIRPSGQRVRYWICQCDCKAILERCTGDLQSRPIASCGCARREKTIERNTTHGLSKSHPSEYITWRSMRARCQNTRNKEYHRYGGRGIVICERWASFEAFFADMGCKPSSVHSIDRIDGDGDYEPGNCRWATSVEQSRNRDCVTKIMIGGRRLVIPDIAVNAGIHASTIRARIRAGWRPEELNAPRWSLRHEAQS